MRTDTRNDDPILISDVFNIFDEYRLFILNHRALLHLASLNNAELYHLLIQNSGDVSIKSVDGVTPVVVIA